jgi:signal transduction histidine kinase
MLILDLQWSLFALLLLAVAALAGFARVGAWSRPPQVPLATLEHAPVGPLVLAGPRTWRYANVAARRLLGLTADGRLAAAGPWLGLLDADRAAARHPGAIGRYRTVALAPESAGSPALLGRAVRWWVTPSPDGDLVLLLDATEQRRAEEAMRSLAGDLAHELRTPLATALTHLEVASLALITDEVRGHSLALIKGELERMIRLVHQMLELGRLETAVDLDRRPLDLLALVEETIAQLRPRAVERGIAVTLEATTPLALVDGDEDRVRQVFLNLLDNATKYCRPGDSVVVSLQPEEGGINCDVRDNGPGIPAEHLPHVTRRFHRAAPSEAVGSGLGLTLVQEIVRRHGGTLEIESRADGPATGTRVSFRLPAAGDQRLD